MSDMITAEEAVPLDEQYDTQMEVERDPFGAWRAIQSLAAQLADAKAQVGALREADIDAALDAMEAYMRREGMKTVAWRTDMPPDDQAKLRACVDAGVRAALASAQGGAALDLVQALRAERDGLKQKLISPDPYEDTAHPDDHAVNRFAAAMKGKLAAKRLQGRGGWQEPEVPNGYLSRLLREHVDKGDPVDVANFAMMVHQRGERIAPENAGASCKAIDEAEAERDRLAAANAALEAQVARLVGAGNDLYDATVKAVGLRKHPAWVALRAWSAALAEVQADARREGGE